MGRDAVPVGTVKHAAERVKCPNCDEMVWNLGYHFIVQHREITAAVMEEYAQGHTVEMEECGKH